MTAIAKTTVKKATARKATKATKAKPAKTGTAKVAKKAKATKANGGGKKTKATKAATFGKKMSQLEAAVVVLGEASEPMTCKQMVDAMTEQGLWSSDAPTPAATLYSAILRDMAKPEPRIKKAGRGLFQLAD